MGPQVVSLAEEVESVLYVEGRINWIFGKLLDRGGDLPRLLTFPPRVHSETTHPRLLCNQVQSHD